MGWQLDPQHPAAEYFSAVNRGRIVSIDHNAGYNSTLFINGQQITVSRGFKKSYRSDGSRWNEGRRRIWRLIASQPSSACR